MNAKPGRTGVLHGGENIEYCPFCAQRLLSEADFAKCKDQARAAERRRFEREIARNRAENSSCDRAMEEFWAKYGLKSNVDE